MLMVSVIGYHVASSAGPLAGLAGALAALAGFLLPSSLLAFGVNRLWAHFEGSSWRTAIQRGLAPMAIGLMGAGVIAIAKVATRDVTTMAMAAMVTVILLRRHINPALLILAGGLVGWLLLRA
jgi:chromate transporter